jgi:hypothetical protein
MDVDIPDAASEQRVAINELKNFCVGRDAGMGQVGQSLKHHLALAQVCPKQAHR